ncbi:hypothetical protein ACO0OL_003581 [Hanseniaspora opuntiae]|uniref:BZIP domain-containing protein n=1 Tax=Hanseniaspora opuntiae TaxID=211096 RepID=A0A1E5RMW1_9ASCO|nr:hypothetical protein AWRI3578_g2090 [Hanseniaspora opuntiae]
MNSLTTEPNPFEQSFKIQAKESSASVNSISIDNNIVPNMDTPVTSLVKSIAKDQPHNIKKNIKVEDNKSEAAAFNSETPRSALFMQYIAQDNQQPENQNVNSAESNPSDLDNNKRKESLLPENSESVIPPHIDNTVAAKNKALQNLSVFKEPLSAGGLSNGLVSPWPFSNHSNISPGLTTPGGRKIKDDIFSNNFPNINYNNYQQFAVNQQISHLKGNQGKVKLTPGPSALNETQKSNVSPSDDFTKQMITNNSYFPTIPRSTLATQNDRQNSSNQQGSYLTMVQGDRLASNTSANGLNSPGSFLNNMGLGNSSMNSMYFGNINYMGNMRTGLTPKIPQPSTLSSNVVSSNQAIDANKSIPDNDVSGLTGPTNINSVNSNGILNDSMNVENNYASMENINSHISTAANSKKNSTDNVQFAKEIKNEILQKKNSKEFDPTSTKKRGRKPGKMKSAVSKPASLKDMDSMTITDIKHHPDLTEEEKKKGILEKNRIAAYNFRQRKKEFIKTLEKKVAFFEKEYEEISDLNTYLMGASNGDSQVGALFQLQSVLGNNEMAKAITAQIIHRIQNTSYQKRNGENPFSYLNDESKDAE